MKTIGTGDVSVGIPTLNDIEKAGSFTSTLSTQPHPVRPHLLLHLLSLDHTASLSAQFLIPGQGYGATDLTEDVLSGRNFNLWPLKFTI